MRSGWKSLTESYEIMESEFKKYKERVYLNLPWYKKLWLKLTKRGL